MKRINQIVVGLILTLVVGCGSTSTSNDAAENKVLISGKLSNTTGKELILMRFANNQPIMLDTATFDDNGEFEMAIVVPQTDFYRLAVSQQNGIVLILSPGEKPVITGDAANMSNGLEIKGSKNTEILWSFYKEANAFGQKSQQLRQRISALPPEEAAQKQELIDEFNQVNTDFKAYSERFITENSESPAVLSALGSFDIKQDVAVFEIARDGLKETFAFSPYYSQLNQSIEKQKEEEAKLKMLEVGNTVPNITENDPEGNPLSLYDLKGKVVLIDFWASWCKPCRAENPNVVRLYKKYAKDGFDVFSISLDKSKDKWLQAIAADGLEWPNHVSDLKFWSAAAAKQYSVSSIPFTVLIDEDSKVIGTKLRGAALENKLREIFGH